MSDVHDIGGPNQRADINAQIIDTFRADNGVNGIDGTDWCGALWAVIRWARSRRRRPPAA
ncbi:hypothetical protein Pth03_76530 [Planotetraspora thailandica]|uniref:Uncharacterized protein n=1 Tax=Planotetraspora thailandica TaxID=487172 RepID=A0A8J4DEI4_9ACTN|nr:hypothetical protein Pth03_76530 [Planotetraspora thailandica]